MTRLFLAIAALGVAFLAGATVQANWPIRRSWED